MKHKIKTVKPKKELNKEEKVQKRLSKGKNWERRFNIEESRVAEYVELYESMGFEVHVENSTPIEKEDCEICVKADSDDLKTLYTKLKDRKMNLK